MAQKTNFNINPYFDDFSVDKNYYKVLFTPGRPIQSRELNTIQSILQNQIESFGSHIFKEGSMVIPGGIHYDPDYHAVKLNPTSFGIDISLYIEKYLEKKITGQSSGLTATVKKVVLPNDDVEDITLYVKYLESGNNFEFSTFLDGETLLSTESITYGVNNTIISADSPFASLISDNATAVGSSASIENGIYFIRGSFVSVEKHSIVLDYYTNQSSYRVGLNVSEQIITAKDDSTLYDNANGFNNFSAPGADRFKIKLELSKKPLTNFNDTNFVELLRVENGILKKLESNTNYNLIKDYLAQRTYDESGNYTTTPFQVSLNTSLNNLIGNNGKYYSGDLTSEGNTPSDDLMCVTVSPGKAYVKGYDVEKTISTVIDVDKPRDTLKINDVLVPFDMGNIIRVNNVYGSPVLKSSVTFYNERRGASSSPSGEPIGNARVYLFKVTDAPYETNKTNWDLYLYDIKLYTELILGTTLSSSQIKTSSRIVGQSSGAIGYAISDGNGTNRVLVRQESGTFIRNENIIIDGNDAIGRNISSLRKFTSKDIKSVYDGSGSTVFLADSVLEAELVPGFNSLDTVTINSSTLTSSKPLSGITTNTLISYKKPGDSLETYNFVTAVNPNTLTLTTTTAITDVNNGTLSGSEIDVRFRILKSSIKNPEKSYLYSVLPNNNISTVDLDGSRLNFSAQAILNSLVSSNTVTLTTTNFTLPGNSSTIKFNTFDPERYSIHYTDGTTEALTKDQVVFSSDYTSVTFNNISNKTIYSVIASFVKTGIQSKVKIHKKSQILDISLSKYERSGIDANSSANDGLTYNRFYGLRVQDEEICLRYPDVSKIIAVYESVGSEITFDKLVFSSIYNVHNNAIIGENIVGKTSDSVARIVAKTTNTIEIVYLNKNKFQVGETVSFENSNLEVPIESATFGSYKDITSAFKLDKGQKDEYYDYSRLIRSKNQPEPSKKIKVVFDYYDVSSSDTGDLYSVASYFRDDYGFSIPNVGRYNVKASDILDFRPRVSYFSASTSSPFDFSSRNFGSSPKVIITPDEASLISYDVYLPRIDRLYLDANGSFKVERGISSLNPRQPKKSTDVLEVASIILPPYLYKTSDAIIQMVDNKRYTMRDIGAMEDRIETLEEVTSLSLLELSAQSFQVKDSDGIDRFKTGFFADSFTNDSLINLGLSLCQIDEESNEMTPLISRNAVPNKVLTENAISSSEYDSSVDYKLLDSRIKKTSQVATLDYKNRDWIEQSLATRIENVNPFHVIQYVGDIRLNPFRDTWIRTERLADETIRHSITLNLQSVVNTESVNLAVNNNGVTPGNAGLGENQFRDTFLNLNMDTGPVRTERSVSSDSQFASSTETTFVDSVEDLFMRSRNTQFSSSNLKALTRYYPFIDGQGNIDVTPKLLEVTNDLGLTSDGTEGVFEIGETVVVWNNNVQIMSFRLASPNHKSGPYNNPTTTYDLNPYNKDVSIPSDYSQSSSILNIDTLSLSEDATGELYGGYLVKGCVLIGTSSGASAYLKDIRLITDIYGDLIGTFFLRDPNTQPPPVLRVPTGLKTFKLSSSPNNINGLIGDTNISSAESTYVSEGIVNKKRQTTRITEVSANLTTINNIRTKTLHAVRQESISTIQTPTPVINNITNVTQIIQRQAHADPLAQTFLVGTARGLNSFNDDANGAFLTAVDIFFQSVDSGNAPITVQIRTTEFGIPTLTIIGDPVTLRPTDVVSGTTILRDNVSTDGSVATRVTFPYPIFLPAGLEYALVLMAPESAEYTVFTARMGEKTINTQSLPDVETVRYTRQFAIGSLFKSQNGSTWTPDQYEDMKFKLYKAEFTSTEGILYLGNSDLSKSNSYLRNLSNNAITTLPRKLKVGIDTITDSSLLSVFAAGRKIGDASKTYVSGIIEKVGSKATAVGIDTGGRNYTTGSSSAVSTYNITGNGSGLILDVTAASNGTIQSVSVNTQGNGYIIGDIVGIVTADITGSASVPSGENAVFTITSNSSSIDTLYLTNVLGESFTDGSLLTYYSGGSLVSLADTTLKTSSTYASNYYDGAHFKVDHFDHGMYATNNLVTLSGVLPDTPRIKMTSALSRNGLALNVASGDISEFTTFEGIAVSATNLGYITLNNEIISYTSASGTELGGLTRGVFGTTPISHAKDSIIQKYETSGVSLARINRTHNLVDTGIGIDSYYLPLLSSGTDGDGVFMGKNRSTDDGTNPKLTFNNERSTGGNLIYASENIVYDTVTPYIDAIVPGPIVNLTGKIRTVSATSCNGTEISFTDLGYEDIQLNTPNKLNSLRMVASKTNADEYLTNIPRSRSQTLALTLKTDNYNLSPMIFLDTTTTEYKKARINRPIDNYITNYSTSSNILDPHEAVYVSKTVRLAQPSNTLKVILSAYRDSSADFRVMYSLIRSETNTSLPNYELFPGYNNLTTDLNLDGYLDIIDLSNNSGLPDKFVKGSTENEFLQYEYTAPNVGSFVGFSIKIVMSSSRMDRYPRFKDIRAIALVWWI